MYLFVYSLFLSCAELIPIGVIHMSIAAFIFNLVPGGVLGVNFNGIMSFLSGGSLLELEWHC